MALINVDINHTHEADTLRVDVQLKSIIAQLQHQYTAHHRIITALHRNTCQLECVESLLEQLVSTEGEDILKLAARLKSAREELKNEAQAADVAGPRIPQADPKM